MDAGLCDLYLRLSDGRIEEAFDGRETKLRAEAARRGLTVRRVVIENDVNPDGTIKPASAFKRKKITLPGGRVEYRVIRPRFAEMLTDLSTGAISAIIAEDLDRVCRNPRDLEDLIDACTARKASAFTLTGTLTLTRGGTEREIDYARDVVKYKNMESRDKRRRASEGRERWAGKSYQGGRRPFGFQVATDTEQYHRNLITDDEEAAAIRAAVTDILDYDISLKAIARQWRDAGLSTVCGNPWSAEQVKDTLCKAAVAGLASYKGDLRPAPWDPIIDPGVWEKLTEKLNDPARTFTTSNEPRWLLSKWATCGICGAMAVCTGGGTDKRTGKLRPRAYSCSAAGHLRRNAAACDEYISSLIVARLSQPDIADLLRPPARSGVDAEALKAEAKRLTRKKAQLARMLADDDIDEADCKRETRRIRGRLAEITQQLAATDVPDPLADFRDRPAQAVWDSLSLARRREVARLLIHVRFMPAQRRGPRFDPDSLQIEWKQQ